MVFNSQRFLMIYLLLLVLTLVFFSSLVGYQKLRGAIKNQALEWILWLGFSLWILIFGICGMSFIKNNYPDINGVLVVAPIAAGAILFIFLNRRKISAKGFNRNDS